MLKLPNHNSTSYPLALKQQLSEIPYDENSQLKFHQFIPKEFFTRTNPRGLLICDSPGQGKTRKAVAIADYYRIHDPHRRIIILLPKSIEGTFTQTITDYVLHEDKTANINEVMKRYKFISLNASNMFKQVDVSNLSKEEAKREKYLADFMEDIVKKNALDNSLLIIDEAHALFNSITNGAKNATQLYDLIMNAKNLKLLFLTGTPIVNDPFELVPCYNMLRGKIPVNDPTNIIKDTVLFSESREEFENYFIDRKNKTIKNKDKFANRIFGLTSYYGDLYFSSNADKTGFPKQLDTAVEMVNMSEIQFARYTSARILEQEETKHSYASKESRFSSSTGGSSTYRIKSRQISNYCIPSYALGPVRGNKTPEKFIYKISFDDLIDLKDFSPKMLRIIDNINKYDNQLGFVYSTFVSGEGIAIFSLILKSLGWVEYENHLDHDHPSIKDRMVNRTFAIITGDLELEKRLSIINKFNVPENTNGSIISLLLISSALAEGITLKRIRHLHIMEPAFNYARINQVIARGVRYLSHDDMPENMKTVQPYIYLSDYPENYPKDKISEPTTDAYMYQRSIDHMQINNSFLIVVVESSMDCSLYYSKLAPDVKERIHCKLCAPTDKPLYNNRLDLDMQQENNCIAFEEEKITADEIIDEETNEKYYYTYDSNDSTNKPDGDLKIYYYDKKLNGYVEMPRNHKKYGNLASKILDHLM